MQGQTFEHLIINPCQSLDDVPWNMHNTYVTLSNLCFIGVKVQRDGPILEKTKFTHEYTNLAIPLLALSQFQALAL